MNNILSSKVLTPEQGKKLVQDFDIEDYVNRDSGEIQATISLLSKYGEEVENKAEELSISSGQSDLVKESKTINDIIKKLFGVLSTRVDEDSVEDKTIVNIKKDDVMVSEHEEVTDTVIDSSVMFFTEIKYHFATVEEHNALRNLNLTEEEFYYAMLGKFCELGLLMCFKFGGKKLSEFDAATSSNIIECNHEWHTLTSVIKADTVKLNAHLKLYPDVKNDLIEQGFIVKEHNVKTKAPGNVQLSLFDDEEEEVNIIPDDADDILNGEETAVVEPIAEPTPTSSTSSGNDELPF